MKDTGWDKYQCTSCKKMGHMRPREKFLGLFFSFCVLCGGGTLWAFIGQIWK